MNKKISLWEVNIDTEVKLKPCTRSLTWNITKDRTMTLTIEERSGLMHPISCK